MKFTFSILSLYSISLISCVEINAIKAQTQPAARNLANEVDKCPKDNSFPVCGTNGVENLLFSNECLLKQAGRKSEPFTKTTLKTCLKTCDLICLKDYDPICAINPATNKTRTFKSECEVVKNSCRTEIDWKFKNQGKCKEYDKKIKKTTVKPALKNKKKQKKRKPIPCPKIFNPVCAIFDGVKSSFINECLVNAENVKTGKDWKIFSESICEEDYSSVSNSPKQQLKVKKRSLNFKDSDIFGNTFELGGPVTLIRPPPVFHTEFIKDDEPVINLNKQAGNVRTYYENQPGIEGKVGKEEKIMVQEYLTKVNNQNDLGFEAFLKNLQNSEVYHRPLYPDSTNMKNQYRAPFEESLLTPRAFGTDQSSPEICNMGSNQLCCSFQKKTRTFKNICELNLHNELTGEDWLLEHEGPCKDCNFKCSNIFEPLCISMNGLQYTIRNKCILDAAICKNGKRAWRIIKNSVCDEVEIQDIKDKYENVAPGFRYISDYTNKFENTSAQEIPTLTTISKMSLDITNKTNLENDQQKTSAELVLKKKLDFGNLEIKKLNDTRSTALSKKSKSKKNTKNGNSNRSNEKAANDEHMIKKPFKNEIKSVTTTQFSNDSTDKSVQKEENSTTTSNIIENLTKLPEVANQNSALNEEKRLSIYGPQENSVMTKLLKALEESTATARFMETIA